MTTDREMNWSERASRHNRKKPKRDQPTEAQVAALHGAVAELVSEGSVVAWVAIEGETFRDLFLRKCLGCWILTTWVDGTVEIEEDYDPYYLVAELLTGTVVYENRGAYRVRWVAEDRRAGLWERYGIHEQVGHYLALEARQRRAHPKG